MRYQIYSVVEKWDPVLRPRELRDPWEPRDLREPWDPPGPPGPPGPPLRAKL